MILQNNENVNISVENHIKKYDDSVNYGYLVCPNCNSSNFIKNGTYRRNVIYLNNNNERVKEQITIQRFKCKNCNKTHAVLPVFVVPYKQFELNYITTILETLVTRNSVNYTAAKLNISRQVVYFLKKQFIKFHRSKLLTFSEDKCLIDIFKNIRQDIYDFRVKYRQKYNILFMQNCNLT